MIRILDIDPQFACQVVSVPLGDRVYRVRLRWCTRTEAWYLDLESTAGESLLAGVRVVPGLNLLAPYQADTSILPDGKLICGAYDGRGRGGEPPGRDSLGSSHFLAYITADHEW